MRAFWIPWFVWAIRGARDRGQLQTLFGGTAPIRSSANTKSRATGSNITAPSAAHLGSRIPLELVDIQKTQGEI